MEKKKLFITKDGLTIETKDGLETIKFIYEELYGMTTGRSCVERKEILLNTKLRNKKLLGEVILHEFYHIYGKNQNKNRENYLPWSNDLKSYMNEVYADAFSVIHLGLYNMYETESKKLRLLRPFLYLVAIIKMVCNNEVEVEFSSDFWS